MILGRGEATRGGGRGRGRGRQSGEGRKEGRKARTGFPAARQAGSHRGHWNKWAQFHIL